MVWNKWCFRFSAIVCEVLGANPHPALNLCLSILPPFPFFIQAYSITPHVGIPRSHSLMITYFCYAQLLANTIQHEKPELEVRKTELLKQEEDLKIQLAQLEESLLEVKMMEYLVHFVSTVYANQVGILSLFGLIHGGHMYSPWQTHEPFQTHFNGILMQFLKSFKKCISMDSTKLIDAC